MSKIVIRKNREASKYPEWVVCPFCKRRFKSLSLHLVRAHGVRPSELREYLQRVYGYKDFKIINKSTYLHIKYRARDGFNNWIKNYSKRRKFASIWKIRKHPKKGISFCRFCGKPLKGNKGLYCSKYCRISDRKKNCVIERGKVAYLYMSRIFGKHSKQSS